MSQRDTILRAVVRARAARGERMSERRPVVERSSRSRSSKLFYSLIESAKLAGVEPGSYLAEAARRAGAPPSLECHALSLDMVAAVE